MAAMKPTTKAVFEYLQANNDKDLTAGDVAEALGLEKRQVDGIFTSAIQRKAYGLREMDEIQLEDGTHEKVKFLRLNEKGLALDLDAPQE